MQIVIDIPEEMYKAILLGANGFSDHLHIVTKLGTPLPKGHGDLKDVRALKAQMLEMPPSSDEKYWDGVNDVEDLIDNAPTIIPADKESEQ